MKITRRKVLIAILSVLMVVSGMPTSMAYAGNGDETVLDIEAAPQFYGPTDITVPMGIPVDFDNPMFRVQAMDLKDGDLTHNIVKVSDNVDENTAGSYEAVFEVTDSDQKTSTHQVCVNIVDENTADIVVERQFYTLPSYNYYLSSKLHRGLNMDRQHLGIYIPKGSTVEIENIGEQRVAIDFFGITEVEQNISKESATRTLKKVDGGATVVFSSETLDHIPTAQTTYGYEDAAKLRLKYSSSDVQKLSYYMNGDNQEEFLTDFENSGADAAIIESDRITILLPKYDLRTVKGAGYSFEALFDAYEEIFATYDEMEGLSLTPTGEQEQNYRMKYFARPDTGTSYYQAGNWLGHWPTYGKASVENYLQPYSWTSMHEIAHGYDKDSYNGPFMSGLKEAWNNVYAHTVQDDVVEDINQTWLKRTQERVSTLWESIRLEGKEVPSGEPGHKPRLNTLVNMIERDPVGAMSNLNINYRKYKESYTNAEYMALYWGEAQDINLLPYMDAWAPSWSVCAAVDEDVRSQVMNKRHSLAFPLADLVYVENIAEDIKERLGLDTTYSLVIPSELESENLKGDVSITLSEAKAESLKGTNLNLYDGSELIASEQIEGTVVNFTDIPIGVYYVITDGNVILEETPYAIVKLADDELLRIRVSEPAAKINYIEGQIFDKTGMVVSADYNDGTTEEVTDYQVTSRPLSLSDTRVEVSYNGKTAYQDISVAARVVEELEITTPPSKTSYIEGQTFDGTGMVVTAVYNDGTREAVTDYEVTSGPLSLSDTRVEISYGGKTVYQAISVVAEIIEINPTQAGFTLASAPTTKQNASTVLWVKNNLQSKNRGNTRYAYVKFDLNDLKDYMTQHDLIIDSAELSYSAKIDRDMAGSKTVYVKEAQETEWNSSELVWNNAPAMGGNIASAAISGTEYQNKTADVTAYLNSRIYAGSSTASLGFEVSQCNGESVCISNTTNNMPTITVKVKIQESYITSIEIDESVQSDKPIDSYTIGDNLDLTKGRIKVTYSDGRTPEYVALNNEAVTVTGYNKNIAGEQTLTVKYMGTETSYKVTVQDTVSSIAFAPNGQPKTSYVQGQQLDRSQGTIVVTYTSGSTVNIPFSDNRITVSGYNKDQVKAQTIKVVYEGKEVTYTVNVNKPANQIADLSITFNRAIAGQNLSLASAKVVKYTGTLTNKQTSNIADTNNIQITGFDKNKGGNQTITVSYGGYSEQMNVYVYTKKTETIKIGVSKANHSKKNNDIASLTSDGYVKNYYNNTTQTYIKMNFEELKALENGAGVVDLAIKSAKLKFQAKGYGNSGNSRYLQVYKVDDISDSVLHNGGSRLTWANNRLKTAIGSHWGVNKSDVRTANWDVTAYVKEKYESANSILFGYGLTQSDNNKEVRILGVYDTSKTYLEVTVEYLK